MVGITAIRAYFPWRRLDRSAVVQAHRWLNPGLAALGKGTRAMASWDEDAITMSVEASRLALDGIDRSQIGTIMLASTTAPFADRQNAGVVATALGLPETIRSIDVGGSQRAATSALMAALDFGKSSPVLVTTAERRRAPAASPQELQFGDAGAAILVSADAEIARYLGGGSTTTDFVDHYREAGRDHDYQWEERWIRDEGILKIVPQTVERILNELSVAPGRVAHFVFASSIRGVEAQVARKAGIEVDAVRRSLTDAIGDCGCAHPMVLLADTLEHAAAGEIVVMAAFGQGCDVLVFEATGKGARQPQRDSVDAQRATGKIESNYQRYLVFNDLIQWDKGKRAERDKQTALTTLYRKRDMLTALVGGECGKCGTRQFPSTRICVNPNCRAVDSQAPFSFADEPASIISWSGDHLVFTLDPPLHYGMIGFAGGGRLLVEFADCEPAEIGIDAPVRMAFRVKDYDSTRGFRRYFWKAVPRRSPASPEGAQ